MLALLGLFAVGATQFAWIRATNFAGYDEWLLLWLGARRIADCPYANRPLGFLWSIPGALITPYGLEGYRLVHAGYLTLSGCWTLLLGRRLAPGDSLFSFLAGAFAIAWAPLDLARLTPVQMAAHSGVTFATFLAILLLLESWRRQRRGLLFGACAVALIVGRSYESPLPLLLCAPLLLLLGGAPQPRRLLFWSLPWLGVAVASAVLFLLPQLAGGGDLAYQATVLKRDPSALGIAARLARQFGHHLTPLVTVPRARLDIAALGIALVVYVLAFLAATKEAPPRPRGEYWKLLGAGAALAALGYSLFTLSPSFDAPHRMQILSAPGIAILLAAAIRLASGTAPAGWQKALAGLLGAWVIAVGTARTLAMQEVWDQASYYPAQRATLVQLVAIAPDLAPNTLVLLVDDAGAWPASFSFRHAVEHFYPGHATAIVWKAFDFLYPVRFTREGVRCETWPVIQRPWGVAPTSHRYDELFIVRRDGSGRLSLLEAWPEGVLPALPEAARYAPRARIVLGAAAPPERQVLLRER